MKILIINWQDIKNPQGGGAEVHLHEIFKRIATLGHKVDLLCCKSENLATEEIIDGINIFRRGSRNLFNFHVPKLYKKEFANKNYDIIIDDINKIPFYTPLYVKEPVLAVSHHFFGKSIFNEASLIAGLYVLFGEKLVDSIYFKTPFAVVSQSTLDEFKSRGFNTDNFEIIFNAINHEEYSMKVVEKYNDPTITFFGRLKKYKSPDHLLKAFAIVQEKIPKARLEIIGRGDFDSELKKLTKELNLQNVTFHGFVSIEKKAELLSRSHLVVNTSQKEGWGITNIEANASGTPVLSANVPGLRDSVSKGISGELYEYGNIKELSSKLINLLSDKEKLNKLSEGAITWAASFSWDDSATKMLEKIKSTISHHKKTIIKR